MIFVGIDPGTRKTGIGIISVTPHNTTVEVEVVTADSSSPRLRLPEMYRGIREKIEVLSACRDVMIAVEWQRSRPGDPRADDITQLCGFSGMCYAMARRISADVHTPIPQEWKGSIPKYVKHNRIVKDAGLPVVRNALEDAGIRVPANLGAFEKEFTGQAADALDALGLALWLKQWYDKVLKEAAR